MFHCFTSLVNCSLHAQHVHDFHEIILILGANSSAPTAEPVCSHHVGNYSFANRAGDLVFLPGGEAHLCRAHDVAVDCLVFYFDEWEIITSSTGDDDVEKILQALLGRTERNEYMLLLTQEGRQACAKIMEKLNQEMMAKISGWRCGMKMMFLELMLTVLRHWDGEQPLVPGIDHIESRERMAGVLRFLETNYMLPLSIDDVMEISCLSRSHFHAIFKKETGHTFKEYLNNVRVRKAKQLIFADEMSLSQVALACGFSSQSHFCHVFKKYTGRTPQQERREELPHIAVM